MTLTVQKTPLAGVLVVRSQRSLDERGYFLETWNRKAFREAGIDADFVQDNHSMSERTGTLRGLHSQSPPHAQAKLIRCTRGAAYDVAVDIRRGSPAYGRWFGTVLTPENGLQLFIPAGFLHGFLTLQTCTEIQYKCSDHYAPLAEGTVRWDSLGIPWPLQGKPIMSSRDAGAPPFEALKSPFVMGENA